MQTCNSKLKLFDLLDYMLLTMGFLFAFKLFFEKTIEVAHRNDGTSAHELGYPNPNYRLNLKLTPKLLNEVLKVWDVYGLVIFPS